MTTTNGEDPVSVVDAALLSELGDLWDRHDPVPTGLVDRIGIALQLRDLELELLGTAGEPCPSGPPRRVR